MRLTKNFTLEEFEKSKNRHDAKGFDGKSYYEIG